MEVVLLEPVKKLGNVGDTVKVKDGYARNFLIPANKALRATKDNVAYFEAKRSEIEKENAKKLKEAEALAKKLEGAIATLVRQAGEDGRLYGSVTAKDIAEALKVEGFEVDRKAITLHEPIKYIGVHTVDVNPHGDVVAKVHPNVSRSEAEAKEAKDKFVRGEVVMEGQGQEEKTSVVDQVIETAAAVEEVIEEVVEEVIEAVTPAEAEAAPKETKAKKKEAKEA